MAATESVFMKSANLHRACELTDATGNKTLVEPYAIFTSAKGRRCFRVFVLSPVPEPGTSAWTAPETASITAVTMTEQAFETRPKWDPFDKELLPMVHYALPNREGRQRWADAPKARAKDTISNFTDRY